MAVQYGMLHGWMSVTKKNNDEVKRATETTWMSSRKHQSLDHWTLHL
jgi:hypothetical protein